MNLEDNFLRSTHMPLTLAATFESIFTSHFTNLLPNGAKLVISSQLQNEFRTDIFNKSCEKIRIKFG